MNDKDNIKIEQNKFLIEEWKSLRGEILSRNTQRDNYLKLAWLSVTGIVSFSIAKDNHWIVLIAPILFYLFMIQILKSYEVHFRISNYISEVLEVSIQKNMKMENDCLYVNYYRKNYRSVGLPRTDYIRHLIYVSIATLTIFILKSSESLYELRYSIILLFYIYAFLIIHLLATNIEIGSSKNKSNKT